MPSSQTPHREGEQLHLGRLGVESGKMIFLDKFMESDVERTDEENNVRVGGEDNNVSLVAGIELT